MAPPVVQTYQTVLAPVADQLPWPGAPTTATDAWHARFPLRFPRWGFGDAWITLAGALVFSVGAGLLLLVDSQSQSWQKIVILLSLVAQWIPMLGWPLLVTRWKGNGAVLDLGLALRRMDIPWGLVGGVAALVSATAVGVVTQKIFGDFDSSAGELLTQFKSDTVSLLLLALGVGIIAPIVEEVCFRGMFWGALAKRGVNPWWVTIWTSVAFAAFHLEPVRFPLLFATGLILGYLRQRTGRLGAGIVAHMVNNLVAVAGLFLV